MTVCSKNVLSVRFRTVGLQTPYTTEMAEFYARDTYCAFSSVFRIHCAVVISGWRTVTGGVTRKKLLQGAE